jgi:UDP-glucose 4-epimerase
VRALITGGAGFIGSHLAERMLQDGHEVLLLDNLSTGSMENIRHLKQYDRMQYFLEPIENRKLLAELVDEAEVVFHLAAAVGVRLIVESPVRTIETNVTGTHLVLEAAAKKHKLVFFASTSEVYGKSLNVPFDEDADLVLGPTTKGRWSYAASKALDEFLALAYWRERKLPVIVARFFNTVGPRQTGKYGMVMPALIGQALAGLPLTVFGTGQQSRCFCDVRDCVEAILSLVGTDRAVGEVINVGTDHEVTIEALAELIRKLTRSRSPITHIAYDKAYAPGFEDMKRRVPSLRKLELLTNFRPRTPLSEIIERIAVNMTEERQMRLAGAAV